jgi:hypothetical protein
MIRREQIRANRKSLARLHVLECNQLVIGESTLLKRRKMMTKREQILANRKSLARQHVLEFAENEICIFCKSYLFFS